MNLSSNPPEVNQVIWEKKPWILPIFIIRTVTVFLLMALFLVLQFGADVAYVQILIFPLWAWTTLIFVIIWVFAILHLIIFWASRTYMLRTDGIEIRRGIIRLHSFVVTPMGFGDLLVYQSLGGRIFGYGDITVNSQGERQTKLVLVRAPFLVANNIREVMGKPVVRVA